jgi:Asp-tRNA(Asn)/Glu-tRNA(Gln) amidotransferase A subunit family amidase
VLRRLELEAAGKLADVVQRDERDQQGGEVLARGTSAFARCSVCLPDYLENYEKLHEDFRLKVESDGNMMVDSMRAIYNTVYRCRESFDALFGPDLDCVLTYAATGEAPVGQHTTGDWVMNSMWTMLNAPCLAIPCHTGPSKMPVGVQIVGPRWGDATLLGIGEAVAPVIDIRPGA